VELVLALIELFSPGVTAETLKMQQDIRTLKQQCNAAMITYVLAKFGEVQSTQ